jgi:hypothetical protein
MVIRTRFDEYEIEVRIESLEDLESAYLSLLSARRELREIQDKHRLLVLADSCRDAASAYWIVASDGRRRVNLDDRGEGIMLSLLDSYPDSRKVKDIVGDTDYPQSSVSDYLNGVAGDIGSCFEKVEGKWKLTDLGLLAIARFLKVLEEDDRVQPQSD